MGVGVSDAGDGTSDRFLTSRASLEVIEVREVEEAAGDNWNLSGWLSWSPIFFGPPWYSSAQEYWRGLVCFKVEHAGLCGSCTSARGCHNGKRYGERSRPRLTQRENLLVSRVMHSRKHGVCSYLCRKSPKRWERTWDSECSQETVQWLTVAQQNNNKYTHTHSSTFCSKAHHHHRRPSADSNYTYFESQRPVLRGDE